MRRHGEWERIRGKKYRKTMVKDRGEGEEEEGEEEEGEEEEEEEK